DLLDHPQAIELHDDPFADTLSGPPLYPGGIAAPSKQVANAVAVAELRGEHGTRAITVETGGPAEARAIFSRSLRAGRSGRRGFRRAHRDRRERGRDSRLGSGRDI